jgi:beta-galactosidase
VRTAGNAAALQARPDRTTIAANGADLSFVTAQVVDRDWIPAPRANNRVRFLVDGPGEIVATDNGDPTSFTRFQSHVREALNSLVLAIVQTRKGATGSIRITASSDGLKDAVAVIRATGS